MPSEAGKYILAIDLGTSGPKVALVSAQGEILDAAIESTRLMLLPNGGAEQDPDDWWSAIKRATQRLLSKGLVPVEAITAVCCTSQWSGTVAVDRAGRHLMNAIIWMDARGAPYIRQVTGGPLAIQGYGLARLLTWLRIGGGVPGQSGKDPIAHILLIQHEHPDVYRQTYKFLEPKDYLNLRLTGQFAASYDSITLHWVTDIRDIHHVRYHDGLLRLARLEREKLPELKRAVDILGSIQPAVADELGLSHKVQVVMGAPDIPSAAFGSGGVRDYEAHLYIGTSSWLTCHVPFKKADVLHNMASLPSAIPGRYFIANEQECAGVCLTFLRDHLWYPADELNTGERPADVYRRFDQLVAGVPAGSNQVLFTPWLNGERTPVDDHRVRGGFYNLSLQTTRAEMVRAVYEGVAYNSRWLLQYVEKFINRRLDSIRMIGGGANSDVWCQIHADVLDRPIHQVQDPVQANVRGAASLAMVAMGYGTFEDIRAHTPIARTYRPTPGHRALYDELFQAYLGIYKNNQGLYKKLNRRRTDQ